MANTLVLSTLPQVPRSGGQFAVLGRLDGLGAWRFLTMPLEIVFDRNSAYSPSGAAGSVPSQQWNRTEGWSMSIQNLPLSGLHDQRSLTAYIQALAALQNPDPDMYAPPVLAFRWGQRVYSPCVLTRFTSRENFWFPNGEVAQANIGFTLIEVPKNQVVTINK